MSVCILDGVDGALFYCSTSDWGFGPLMKDQEEAEAFLAYLKQFEKDARRYSDSELERRFGDFKRNYDENTMD